MTLEQALQNAETAARWAREHGVSRLQVKTGDGEVVLELGPAPMSPADFAALEQLSLEDPIRLGLDPSSDRDASPEAAAARILAGDYGRAKGAA